MAKATQFQIRLDNDLLGFIDQQAEKSHLDRSKYIRQQLWRVHDEHLTAAIIADQIVSRITDRDIERLERALKTEELTMEAEK